MGVEAGLQSGFVIGVVVAALLFADRLGGATMLALRAAQLALGVVLAMLVLSATSAVQGPLDTLGPSDQGFAAVTVEFARRSSVVGTVHIGLAIIFVAGGVALLRAWSAIAPGILVGGVLLMLVGLPTGWTDGFIDYHLLHGTSSGAGDARIIARVIVLLVGAGLLVATIYLRWERDAGNEAAEAADSGASSP